MSRTAYAVLRGRGALRSAASCRLVTMASVAAVLLLALGATPALALTVVTAPWGTSPDTAHVSWAGPIRTGTTVGNPTLLKAVARGAAGSTAYYRWDADGDGVWDVDAGGRTQAISSGHWYQGDPFSLSFTYRYAAGGTSPRRCLATIEVADNVSGAGVPVSSTFATYPVLLAPRSSAAETDKAVDDALWNLQRTQVRTSSAGVDFGSWPGPSYFSTAFATAQAVEALEAKGHLPSGDPATDPYVDTVRRGLNTLLADLDVTLTATKAGADGNANGIGLGITTNVNYDPATAVALAALCQSQSPTAVVACGNPAVDGRTYADVAQDMVDFIAFSQRTPGGYFYGDASMEGFALHGLERAHTCFAISAPAWLPTYHANWLVATQRRAAGADNGAFADYADAGAPVGFQFTADGLAGLGYCGGSAGDAAVTEALGYLDRNWTTATAYVANLGDYEAMYALSRAAGLFTPALGSVGGHDWNAEYARYLIDHQTGYAAPSAGPQSPGAWDWPSGSPAPPLVGQQLSAIAALILRQRTADSTAPGVISDAAATYSFAAAVHVTATDPGGWGVAGVDYWVDGGAPVHVDGGAATVSVTAPGHHHLQFAATDLAGNRSATTDTAFDVVVSYAVPPVATPQMVTVGVHGSADIVLSGSDPYEKALTYRLVAKPLRGTLTGAASRYTYTPCGNAAGKDSFTFVANNGATDSAAATVNITVAQQPPPAAIRPVAVAGGPYILTLPLATLHLDGRASYDANVGDTLTYAWDLDGDGLFDDATGATPDLPASAVDAQWHPVMGQQYAIGLKVTDNTGLTSDASETTLQIAAQVPPMARPGGPYTVRTGSGQVTLDGSGSYHPYGDAFTLTWSINDTVVGTGTTLTLSWAQIVAAWPAAAARGWTPVKLVVSNDADSSIKATALTRLTAVGGAPTAQAQQLEVAFGAYSPVTLGASDPEGDALTYRIVTWPQHGTLSGVAPDLRYVPNSGYGGADAFTFVAGDGVLESAPATVDLTVLYGTTAPVPVYAGTPDAVVPAGQVLTVDAGWSYTASQTHRIVSYAWDWGDGTVSSGVRASHLFATVGDKRVTLTVTDDIGRFASVWHTFLVSTTSVPVAVSGGPYTIAAGGTLHLDGTASYDNDQAWGDAIAGWAWDLNGDASEQSADAAFEVVGATQSAPVVGWAQLTQYLAARGIGPSMFTANPVTGEPSLPILLRVTDKSGRRNFALTRLRIFDVQEAPASTIVVAGPLAAGGAYTGPATVTLGLPARAYTTSLHYSTDGGATWRQTDSTDSYGRAWTVTLELTGNGAHVVQYYASDRFGNQETPKSTTVTLDIAVASATHRRVAAGARDSLEIDDDGMLWACGGNIGGELGVGDRKPRTVPAPVAGQGWVHVAGEGQHTVALNGDGTLWEWGGIVDASLDPADPRLSPAQIAGGAVWGDADCGSEFAAAVRTDGTLWTWGNNGWGQLGLGDATGHPSEPNQVGADADWAAVACGADHTLALKSDGTLWAWGRNAAGQLGSGDQVDVTSPVQIGSDEDWVQVDAGGGSSFAIKADGSLWAWGAGGSGVLGLADTAGRTAPEQVDAGPWATVATGGMHTLAVKKDGTLWGWGSNGYGQLALTGHPDDVTTPVRIGSRDDWAGVACGAQHSLVLARDGSFEAWGDNGAGQIGAGYPLARCAPEQVGTADGWANLDAGYNYGVGIRDDGTLWAWGHVLGFQGALVAPAQVGTAADWRSASCGDGSTLLLKQDGSLWAWGFNGYGQLGLGDTDAREAPAQVGTATDWASVAVGHDLDQGDHALAVKQDGTLWAWGSNIDGALGYDTGSDADTAFDDRSRTPQQVGTAADWRSVAAGKHCSLALKSDGTLWAWGRNAAGELGLGDKTRRATPTQVGVATDWRSVAVGADYDNAVLAVRTDGTLWAWGSNDRGQLGAMVGSQVLVPTRIGTDADWLTVACGGGYGEAHTLALKQDHSLWAWGTGYVGAVGAGDYVTRYLPTRIGDGTHWASVAGGNNSFALRQDGTLWAWGGNDTGQLGLGDVLSNPLPVDLILTKAVDPDAPVASATVNTAGGSPTGVQVAGWPAASVLPSAPPPARAVAAPGVALSGWYKAPVDIAVSAADDGWGVSRTRLSQSDGVSWVTGNTLRVSGVGMHTLQYAAIDRAGNASEPRTLHIGIDTAPPVTAQDGADAAWHRSAVTVTFSANDDLSGVAATEFRLDAGDWTAGLKATIASDGDHTLRYRSSDGAGNMERAQQVAVRVDTTRPVPKAIANAGARRRATAKLKYSVADNLSAACAMKIVIKRGAKTVKTLPLGRRAVGKVYTASVRCTWPKGRYSWYVYATDLAGNVQLRPASRTLVVR